MGIFAQHQRGIWSPLAWQCLISIKVNTLRSLKTFVPIQEDALEMSDISKSILSLAAKLVTELHDVLP